ncbi:MAG: FAD-dependent oxidoreductase [Clostridia bacterium]|nr:FAD-dependent oxidoreductase [Clostridia bacterium]
MTDFIYEPAKNIPVDHTTGVLICGGGIAGVAAALAAARQGEKVLLLEREYALGGLATLGLISIYLPICDGKGRQVSFGLAEELLHLTDKYGPEGEKQTPWLTGGTHEEKIKSRYETHYNPNLYAIELEKLLQENGVEILYGALVCAVEVENGLIKHVIIENKSGRSAIAVKSVVDATGDADVCHLAGEDTALFGQGNVLAGWYYHTADGVHALRMSAASDIPDKYKSPERLEADKSRKRYSGIDGDEISRYMQDSHASTLASFLKSGNYDYKKHALSTITAIPQLRMTRRVAGVYTQDDTETFREYADSVGMFSDWRNRGPVYELPFGTLHGRKIRNLIAAGRCISGTDAMWDITRVIPVCAVSGEAAGTAAAMTNDIPHIDITELQRRLRNAGVKIHISDLESIMEGNT